MTDEQMKELKWLFHLQDKILKTSQALGRLESEAVLRPDSRSLRSNILSLNKLHNNLQHDFDARLWHSRMRLKDHVTAVAIVTTVVVFGCFVSIMLSLAPLKPQEAP